MSTDNTYDIIFAGGGAAGCVTASRLAEADPSLKILVVEAGPLTKDVPDVVQPARYMRNLMRGAPTISYHIGKPSPSTANRVLIVPAGRCLGGGSSINFAMYTRASASDYDDWETIYKNPGWGSKHLIPLINKAETFQSTKGDLHLHGKSGPLKISYSKDLVNVGEEWLDVAAKYDKDRQATDDVNGFYSCNAYGRWAQYVDATNGHRSDIPHNYIYNHPEFKNLTILTSRRVTRVIFEGNRAVGVEHVDDVQGRPNKAAPDAVVARASRLVVLASGAFGSPAILERSGVGSAELLGKLGVQTLVDLPGVGEHYMDHNLIFGVYAATDEADTLDALFRASDEELLPIANEWLQGGSGLMAHNGVDAGIKIRPTEKDLEEIGPEFRARWEQHYANAPDKPLFFMGVIAGTNGAVPVDPKRKYFGTGYYTEYPASTGRVHITDAANPYAPMDFEPGFLDDPADVVILRWAYKKAREFARRMKFYRGEVKLSHPAFADGSAIAPQEEAQPVDIAAPNLQYTTEDDKLIDEHHRRAIGTSWHSIGTCAMKPRELGGVVDPRLNVYGVQNLKVADCSICPGNVGANTYNTAIAIGEKAAVIIAADLGIAGVTEA